MYKKQLLISNHTVHVTICARKLPHDQNLHWSCHILHHAYLFFSYFFHLIFNPIQPLEHLKRVRLMSSAHLRHRYYIGSHKVSHLPHLYLTAPSFRKLMIFYSISTYFWSHDLLKISNFYHKNSSSSVQKVGSGSKNHVIYDKKFLTVSHMRYETIPPT